MEDGHSKFNVAKMTLAFLHTFATGCTLEVAIDRTHPGIAQAIITRARPRLVHGFGVLNVRDTETLDFLW